MKKLYITSMLALAVLFSPQAQAQQSATEYLNTFKVGVYSERIGHILIEVLGARLADGKSLRVLISKDARLSGNDQVSDGAGLSNIAVGLYVGLEDNSRGSRDKNTNVIVSSSLNLSTLSFGLEAVSESEFQLGDWQPGPGDVYYIYLSLYDNTEGSGRPAGTREIQFAVPARNGDSDLLPAEPEFAIRCLGPPVAGEANVELVAGGGIDEHTRVFFTEYSRSWVETLDATVLADAADPGSGLYPAPDIVWDDTGGARVSAELPAGRHYFYATNRNEDGYKTQELKFDVPSSGLAGEELKKIRPQFAISESTPTTLRLLRKGDVFAEGTADATKTAFAGYRILYGTSRLSGLPEGNILGHEVGDADNPLIKPTDFEYIDISKADPPEETGKSPVEIRGLTAETKYYIYVIALDGEGTGAIQSLETTTLSRGADTEVDLNLEIVNVRDQSFGIKVDVPLRQVYDVYLVGEDQGDSDFVRGLYLGEVWDAANPSDPNYRYFEFPTGEKTEDIAIGGGWDEGTNLYLFARVRDALTGAIIGGPYRLSFRIDYDGSDPRVPRELTGDELYEAEETHNSIRLSREQQISPSKTHYFYLTKTALPLFNPSFVADGASTHTDFSSGYETQTATSGLGSNVEVDFTGLDENTLYYVYVIARFNQDDNSGENIYFQHLQVRTGVSAPDVPAYALTSTHNSITFTQDTYISVDETHYLFVSKSALSNLDNVAGVQDAVTHVTHKHEITSSTRAYTFTGLDSETPYYVYAIARNAGSIVVAQTFDSPTITTGIAPAVVPTFARTSTSDGGFTISQSGNVPAGVTYHVLVSRTNLSAQLTSRDAVGDITDDGQNRKVQTVSGDVSASVDFSGLTAGTTYNVHVVAFKTGVDAPVV
ncbi:MAG: hypothetical protein OXB93_03590, partial [Cytophagales bacterium]|nr:hypothetical protein [Cytophagales bacterium]